MSDSFFVSDILKDVIDESMLMNEEVQIQQSGETEISGNFVSFSLAENEMTLDVSSKFAKFLLSNPDSLFTFSFMDETWCLSSKELKLRQEKEGKYFATLYIISRRKEDTYERTV